jgi:hypothetical protein
MRKRKTLTFIQLYKLSTSENESINSLVVHRRFDLFIAISLF